MQPDHAIIVYRSQTAANTDMFIQDVCLWTYNHWYVPVIIIGAVILWTQIVKRR